MIDVVFFLQLFLVIGFSFFALKERSWALFICAAILCFATAIMVADEGVTYFLPLWDVKVSDANISISQISFVHNVSNSNVFLFWYWSLIVLGLLWLTAAAFLILRWRVPSFFRR